MSKKENLTEEVEVEKVEDIKEEKPKKDKNEKSTFSKIMNVVLWIIIIAWMAICATDYIKTVNEKEPIFCLKEETHEYSDGTVYECTGVGYKYFNYNRKSYNATQFGGIWIKEHNPDKD